nr:tyrosine-type recombinase/integrase [uncultured Porphyromonas sp.]
MPTPPNYIQAFLDYLRSEVDASPMTIHAYSVDLWAFLAYTEERLGEPFTPTEHDLDLVRNWLSHRLDTGSKASSVGKYLASLKSYYRYLLRCGIIRVNPIQSLRPPKADKPLPVYVPTAELNRLIDESSEAQDWIGVRDQLLLSILYECGLRRSELAGLLDRNVDLHSRQLKVLGKGRKERIVPFGEGLAQAIKHWRDIRDERFGSTETLLVTSRGGAMSPEAVYQVVHRALASVPHLSRRGAHALRHSFATDMLNSGGDLMLLRELLGHNSVSTTVRYTHTSFEQLKQVYQAHPRAHHTPPDEPEGES